MKQRGGDAKVADEIGCCRSFVFMVRKGGRVPGRHLLDVIERKYDIPARDWPIPKRKSRKSTAA